MPEEIGFTDRLHRVEMKLDMVLHMLGAEAGDIAQLVAIAHDNDTTLQLINKLKQSATALQMAVAANQPHPHGVMKAMANPILDALAAQVQATTNAEASAVTLINGIADRIQTAVNAALAGGATAAELAPIQAEIVAMKASADALAAAVVANTTAMP